MRLIFPFLTILFSLPGIAFADDGVFSLEDAVRSVDANGGPSIGSAQANIDAARAGIQRAKSGWRPTISGDASVYHTYLDNNNFTGADGATTKDIGLGIEQNLYQGGRTVAQQRKAAALYRASLENRSGEILTLKQQVITAYMQAARDDLLRQLTTENEAILDRQYTAIQRRFTLGDTVKTNVEQTSSRLERARAERISSQTDYDSSLAILERLLGYKPDGALFLPDTSYLLELLPNRLDQTQQQAIKANYDLKVLDKNILADRADIDAQDYGLRPNVTAFASTNKQYDPQPGIIDDALSSTIGVRARWIFYDGGLTQANKRTARAALLKRQYDRQALQRQITQTITQLWVQWQDAKQERVIRARQVVASDNVNQGVKKEVDLGERNMFDLLDSEQEMLEAQAAYIRAQTTEKLMSLRLAGELDILPY